ncbi:MAG: helix-turn-helix domain-containing protein [Oscillospiraceae bacterium]|nr:helix-turn-helix domain-containing protein [Oscillospiraceae bacterium]MBO7726977.1 helix-turn-helix domain-containing protein [Oscillospiraceae bacterium]
MKSNNSMRILRPLPDVKLGHGPTKAAPDNPNIIGVKSNHIKVRDVPKRPDALQRRWESMQQATERKSQKRKEREAKAIELFRQGKSLKEIVAETGWGYSTVCKYTQGVSDLKRRPKGSLDEQFVRMYEQGMAYSQIAKELGVTKEYVSNKLSRLRRKEMVGRRRKA